MPNSETPTPTTEQFPQVELLKAAPSKEAIVKFLNKEKNAIQDVVVTMGARSLLIAAGIALLGSRDHVIRNSIAGSVAIEAYLFWHYSQQMKEIKKNE